MPREIQPLQPDETDELSRFLTTGFGTPADAPFALPEVLRWKYFDPFAADFGPRSFVVRESGAIVGHLGLCPSKFITGLSSVPTLHMIDWLGSRGNPGVGASLLRMAQRLTPTQYGFGGSVAGRRVLDAARYHLQGLVPVFQRVLKPGYRLRTSESPSPRTLAASARDAARLALQSPQTPPQCVTLLPVSSFGDEIALLTSAYAQHAVFTSRDPDLLNHLLRHPDRTFQGSLLVVDGAVRGFALLNVVVQGRARIGRIVDCILDNASPTQWHGAIHALTAQLQALGADVAFGCGGPPWVSEAYRANQFRDSFPLEFRHRDRDGLIPRDQPFHLTFVEADYSYLP